MEEENIYPECPVCKAETYTTPADEEYYNIWCTNEDCDWFTEVDYEA